MLTYLCVFATFRLTVDLTDAERYREAYHNLVDEVGVLVARNQLAESEANRLSQFNAEILAHNNPAQRIVYLDRVRRELAEAKQVRSCHFTFVPCRVPRHVTALHHCSSSVSRRDALSTQYPLVYSYVVLIPFLFRC